MGDPVEDFFNGLAQRGYEPMLHHNKGSIRFDLKDGDTVDHWRVMIDMGKVAIGRDDEPADTEVTEDREIMVEAIQGKQSVMIALALGQMWVSGNVEQLASFQRLFAQPPQTVTTQAARG